MGVPRKIKLKQNILKTLRFHRIYAIQEPVEYHISGTLATNKTLFIILSHLWIIKEYLHK